MDQTEDKIRDIVKNKGAYVESCILSTIINNNEYWLKRCHNNINSKKDKFSTFKDFGKPIDNDIYEAIDSFYSILTVDSKIDPSLKINESIIVGAIKSSAKADLSMDYISSIKMRLSMLKDEVAYDPTIYEIADSCFDYWLETRRTKQLANDALSSPTSIQDMLDKIKRAGDNIVHKSSSDTKSIMSIFESYANPDEENTWDRIPIPNLGHLSKIMGGGIKKQECMLIVAPPAGGKTSISCQIAVGLAMVRKRVVYITTEQPGAELLPKMISCGACISYEKIKDGVRLDGTDTKGKKVLTDEEVTRMSALVHNISDFIVFEDWCSSGGKIKRQLGNTIDQHKNKGGVDIVIIDWLGGGVDMEAKQGDLKRFFLDECCQVIKDASIKYNVAIITCSQASSKKCEDLKYITSSEISESTMLHTYFTWGLGVSALGINKKGNFNGEVANKNTRQFFNLFKTRKSQAVAYPVVTDFEHSRFIETIGDPNIDSTSDAFEGATTSSNNTPNKYNKINNIKNNVLENGPSI